MKEFSNIKLKQILNKKGISQVSLSERLDLTPSTVSAWLKGKSIPEKQNIKKVADLLCIEENELLIENPQALETLGNNHASVYISNCDNINITNNRQADILFLDADILDSVTVSIKLSTVTLSRIILKAHEMHKDPGQFLSDLIEQYISNQENA